MRMQDLNSGDSVGASTNGTGGLLLGIWEEDGDQTRALLTVRETEWLIEHLTETLERAKLEHEKQTQENEYGREK